MRGMLPKGEPGMRKPAFCVVLSSIAVLMLAGALPAEEAAPKNPVSDQEAQKRTIADLRNVGTILVVWVMDQAGAVAAGPSETETPDPEEADPEGYSPISRQELEKVLGPRSLTKISKIPETDGWGHPYEFYLNVADPAAEHVIMIRSPGRDGKFSNGRYRIGTFAPDDFDQDLVWTDGYFARWPEAAK
jgi:hypothetical protein